MYGFYDNCPAIIHCAKLLQEHIERVCCDMKIIPYVSISLSPTSAIIEVIVGDCTLQIWHSEADPGDGLASIKELFAEKSKEWIKVSARFI